MSAPSGSPLPPNDSTELPQPAARPQSPPIQTMSFFVPFGPPGNAGPSSAVDGPGEQDRPGIMWRVEMREEGGGPSLDGSAPRNGPIEPMTETAANISRYTEESAGSTAPTPHIPRVPPFFFVTPNGGAHPQFIPIPHPQDQAQPGNPTHHLRPLPHTGPDQGHAPPWVTYGQSHPLFSFFLPVSSEPQPDPAKAAELIRSLPTVGKSLLKRVDRIIAAEEVEQGDDEEIHGWKCGVCLDGVENEESKETEVKALPCNHLYHAGCLEPWLASRHTCPACRLDLDPLHTLRNPQVTRQSPLRPTHAGSPHTNAPHPYARGPESSPPSPTGASAFGPQAQPQNQPQPGQAPFTFIWRMPMPTANQTPPTQPESIGPSSIPAQPLHQTSDIIPDHPSPSLNVLGPMPQVTPPRVPNMIFNVPIHASPISMARSASSPASSSRIQVNLPTNLAVPGVPPNMVLGVPLRPLPMPMPIIHSTGRPSGVHEQPAASSSGQPSLMEGRPHPERRPHIAFRPGPPLVPPHMHTHMQNEPNASSSHTHPPHHHHHVVHHHPMSTQVPMPLRLPLPIPSPMHMPVPMPMPMLPQIGLVPSGRPTPPHLEFLMNHSPPGTAQRRPHPERPTPEAEPQATPFVPQSLESWTEQREKALGWRCDGTQCLIAPSTDPNNDVDMLDEEISPEGKEMLSIYSPLQLPFAIHQDQETSTNTDTRTDAVKIGFVILACDHRWHRACLETAERSAGRGRSRGRTLEGDCEGEGDRRVWVRCPRCRKDGWVEDLEGTPSEGEKAEVERLVTA